MSYHWNWGVFLSPVSTGEPTTYLGWLIAGFWVTVTVSLASWILALVVGYVMAALLFRAFWPTSIPTILLGMPVLALYVWLGLAIVCMTALAVVWSTWVMVPPAQAARLEIGPWTNRVGLIVAIAWPLQCGLGMIVLS